MEMCIFFEIWCETCFRPFQNYICLKNRAGYHTKFLNHICLKKNQMRYLTKFWVVGKMEISADYQFLFAVIHIIKCAG